MNVYDTPYLLAICLMLKPSLYKAINALVSISGYTGFLFISFLNPSADSAASAVFLPYIQAPSANQFSIYSISTFLTFTYTPLDAVVAILYIPVHIAPDISGFYFLFSIATVFCVGCACTMAAYCPILTTFTRCFHVLHLAFKRIYGFKHHKRCIVVPVAVFPFTKYIG